MDLETISRRPRRRPVSRDATDTPSTTNNDNVQVYSTTNMSLPSSSQIDSGGARRHFAPLLFSNLICLVVHCLKCTPGSAYLKNITMYTYPYQQLGRYLPDKIRLYKYHEVPKYMQENRWILTGYRANLPLGLCVKSMFYWSNETVNMWSHLLGALGLIFFLVYDNVVVIPRHPHNFLDHCIPTISLVCFQICMVLSFLYHLLCAHSEKMAARWLGMDLLGISVGLIGIFIPALYYGFTCHPVLRDVYTTMFVAFSLVVVGCQLHPDFRTNTWRHVRLILYSGLGLFGVVPTVHWVYLHGSLYHPIVFYFLQKVVWMYVLSGVGAIVYFTRVPERFIPGVVDYVGNSHNLWHFLTMACFYYWHYVGTEFIQFMLDKDCNHIRANGL